MPIFPSIIRTHSRATLTPYKEFHAYAFLLYSNLEVGLGFFIIYVVHVDQNTRSLLIKK